MSIGKEAKKQGIYPKDWKVLKIEDVADVKGGKRLPKGYSLKEQPNGYPYITVSDMYLGGISTENIKYVPEEVVEKIKNYRISKDDLFISVAGTLGIVGKVPDELDHANLTENADKLTNIKIDKEYLYQVLISDIVQKEIEKEKTTNAQPKLALTRIKNFTIPVPSNEKEIKKIAIILSTWDKAIELKEKLIEQKKEQKKGLVQKLLTGEVRLPDWRGEIKTRKLKGFIKEIKQRNKDNSVTKILSVTNSQGFINQSEQFGRQVASEDLSNYKIIKKGQFAYNPSRVNVGSIDLLTKFNEGILSPMYVIFETDHERLYSGYLYHFLKSKLFLNQMGNLLQGSVRQSLSFDGLEQIKLFIPTEMDEQKEIAHILSLKDKEINLLEKELQELKNQKRGLMQLLLTGKVRVQV